MGWIYSLAIVCPLSLGNAVLSSSCSRRAGDSCTFSCSDGYIPTTSERLMCISDGTWNLDTDTLCTRKKWFLSKTMSFYNTNDDKVTLTIKIDKIMKKVKI